MRLLLVIVLGCGGRGAPCPQRPNTAADIAPTPTANSCEAVRK